MLTVVGRGSIGSVTVPWQFYEAIQQMAIQKLSTKTNKKFFFKIL